MQENVNNRNLFGYLLMAQNKNEDALNIFKENVEKYPQNWNVYDSLGEAYANTGEMDLAKKYYNTALDMAPANQKTRIENILEGFDKNN
jgi:Flp pilus assembly protein TadD